jgi:hypothetical protein
MRLRLSFLAPALATVLAACASAPYDRVMIDIPAVSPVTVERYGSIVVEDFRETQAVPDVPLGRRTAEYLEAELRREFKGTVARRGTAAPPAEGLVLSGTIGLTQLAQKALREKDIIKDGPFGLEDRGLVERKVFTMTVEYKLTDAATGAVVLTGSLRESRTYGDVQQSPDFALFDLFPLVKARLFPDLFGRALSGERYLLLR